MQRDLAISEPELNELIRGELWGLHLDAKAIGTIVPESKALWLTIREGDPRMKIYYVLHDDTCQLMWLELDPERTARHQPR